MTQSPYLEKTTVLQSGLWKNRNSILGLLNMELTERCNQNCLHCCINRPAGDREAQKRELSTKEIKRILREAESLGCMSVRFTGGEPLLRSDFKELYCFARNLGLRVLIFTNATLITESLADLFSKVPPLIKIEITVYGMRKSSYEAVTRTPASFEAAFRGIYWLLQKKVPFVVKGAVLPPNRDERDEFKSWAAALPGMDRPPSETLFFDLHCRHDEKKNESIRKLRLTPEEGLEILNRRKEEYVTRMKDFCFQFVRPAGEWLFPCGAGCGRKVLVDAYGNFQPCMMLRHPEYIYDLRKGSLRDALENFFPKIRELRAQNPEYLRRCAKCFLKGLCEQCPAKSWTEHGTLDTPVEYLCEIAHTQAKDLGLLREGELAWEVEDWQERVKNFVEDKPRLEETLSGNNRKI